MSTTSKFYVVCDDYRVECKTRDAAERRLEAVEKMGACTLPHSIEERVITDRATRARQARAAKK